MPPQTRTAALCLGLALLAPAAATARASSHREAPAVTEGPKIDATDFYMFNSYEAGRQGFVTIIADYLPLQDPYGGPNYFTLDPDALYEIHIDNDGDAREDLTFQFRFTNTLKDLALDIGPEGQTKRVSVPILNIGPIAPGNTAFLNIEETFTARLVRGNRRTGAVSAIRNLANGSETFAKPVDNIGTKSIADYESYARAHVYDIALPGGAVGRLFVGQRKDPFVVNLGEVFDLVNLDNPLGPVDGEQDDLADKNVTSLILEVPASFLTAGTDPVIAGWTTASLRQARVLNPTPSFAKPSVEGGAWTQQSRLANPLVNEVVIGLKDKDRFNASKPEDDAQFADYVTNPTLPALIEILFGSAGVRAPILFPRNDLVAVFLTGVDGLNGTAATAELLRLNTSTPAVPVDQQNSLGVIGGDTSGYPNGRRPGDDIVDISLRVVMGRLLPANRAPSGLLEFTDGAIVNASFFDETFPYLKTPIPGATHGAAAR